jgi:DNA-binding transcriptional ArsR family regulator
MEPPDASSPEGLPCSHLVLDARVLASVRRLRPMPWAVLEAVALVADADGHELVARTSARHLADLLGVDPGTAAAGLRVLRRHGVLELRRAGGPGGRFGLSAYILGDIAELGLRPCVGSPGVVPPHVGDPRKGPCGQPAIVATAPSEPGSAGRRSTSRPAGQAAFDLDLEGDG